MGIFGLRRINYVISVVILSAEVTETLRKEYDRPMRGWSKRSIVLNMVCVATACSTEFQGKRQKGRERERERKKKR